MIKERCVHTQAENFGFTADGGMKGCIVMIKGQRRWRPARQNGQAVLEALLVCLALLVLWVAVGWLGRIQDMALHGSHAARYVAFMSTREDDASLFPSVQEALFDGARTQWLDRSGNALQGTVYEPVSLDLQRSVPLAADAQPGAAHADAVQLRRGWEIADTGITTATARFSPLHSRESSVDQLSLLKLDQLDHAYPSIARHVSIMTGSGHASSDTGAAARIANSDLGWSSPVDVSVSLGRRIAPIASAIDGGWHRPMPVFEWLGSWADRLPQQHLRQTP